MKKIYRLLSFFSVVGSEASSQKDYKLSYEERIMLEFAQAYRKLELKMEGEEEISAQKPDEIEQTKDRGKRGILYYYFTLYCPAIQRVY